MDEAVPALRITVLGLGYVGLPVAVALADQFEVVGFDIDSGRIDELKRGHDRTGEIDSNRLVKSPILLTDDSDDGHGSDLFIVTVPTPVDSANRPDLGAVIAATRTVAAMIDPARRPTVVYESTVYPGVTEGICGVELERQGLVRGRDFRLGYSPERINPGDREHTVDRITKVIAGEDADVVDQLAAVYGAITSGGVFRAASIKAAEAAKAIENAQRDINIAFMNEIAQIVARLDLSMWDVLDAAKTKWNFLPFEPGLVGGHCIGVDPYYLSHVAEENGVFPQVVLSGRGTNDGMGEWIAQQLHQRRDGHPATVRVLGATFKENVPDLRNSRVFDVVRALQSLGHTVAISDPKADPQELRREFGFDLSEPAPADILVGAVAHDDYRGLTDERLSALINNGGLVADIKGIWRDRRLRRDIERWTL